MALQSPNTDTATHIWKGFHSFLVFLCSDSQQGSVVTFGGVDPNHYSGSISWIPLSNELYWQITVDRYGRRCYVETKRLISL